MERIDVITVGLLIALLATSIVFAVLLGTNFFSAQQKEIGPFRRLCARACLTTAIVIVIAFLLGPFDKYTKLDDSLVKVMEGIVFMFIFLASDSISTGQMPRLKQYLTMGMPYAIILIIQAFIGEKCLMFGPFATFLVTLVFYIKTTLKLRKYDKELMDSRSNLEQATTEWFMIITFIIFIEIGLWFGFALIATYGTIARLLFPLVTFVGWVMMAHYAMIQKHEPAKPIVKEIESEEQDDVEKSTIDLVHDSLVALMEEKQFYLNPDLTIDMLAEELHTTSISQSTKVWAPISTNS